MAVGIGRRSCGGKWLWLNVQLGRRVHSGERWDLCWSLVDRTVECSGCDVLGVCLGLGEDKEADCVRD